MSFFACPIVQVLRARLERKGRSVERARKAAAAQRTADRTAQRELELRLLHTQARWTKDADAELALAEAKQRPRSGVSGSTLGWLKARAAEVAGSVLPTDKDFDFEEQEDI